MSRTEPAADEGLNKHVWNEGSAGQAKQRERREPMKEPELAGGTRESFPEEACHAELRPQRMCRAEGAAR